jgi:hypothetical protein
MHSEVQLARRFSRWMKREGGRAKWSWHSVTFRDSGEKYNHYTNGNWQGVVSLVRQDMVNNAK